MNEVEKTSTEMASIIIIIIIYIKKKPEEKGTHLGRNIIYVFELFLVKRTKVRMHRTVPITRHEIKGPDSPGIN